MNDAGNRSAGDSPTVLGAARPRFGDTSKEANRSLDRTGAFWQREYYDRLVRDEQELERAIEYVRANPENAGLSGWKWLG